MKYDVIIVGAGPAGSTTAKFLEEKGFKTLLLDKEKFPREKPCGGGLPIRVLKRFPYINNDAIIEVYSSSGTVFSPTQQHKIEIYKQTPIIAMTLRKKFDHALVKFAQKAGAIFQEGASVSSHTITKDTVTIIMENGTKIESEIIVGADGVNSTIARDSGLRTSLTQRGVCVLQEYEVDEKTGRWATPTWSSPPTEPSRACVRGRQARLGTTTDWRPNKFIWYGTTRAFDNLTLTFRPTAWGVFCAHHYRYAPDRSTFLVEVQADTWQRAGLDAMSPEDTVRLCERVFTEDLQGHPILSNRSHWRNFPAVWNERWSDGNVVLLGDALRTAHFSIGSGTRLAMEDAAALCKALRATGKVKRIIFLGDATEICIHSLMLSQLRIQRIELAFRVEIGFPLRQKILVKNPHFSGDG